MYLIVDKTLTAIITAHTSTIHAISDTLAQLLLAIAL
jgi:hypothetical protein